MSDAKKVCCVCGGKYSCNFNGQPYCNKHWLRLYNNGTLEIQKRKSTNRFEIKGNDLIITTAKGTIILADAEDYEKLSKYSWCISKTGYAVANINHKVRKMHRYILGLDSTVPIIDHKNGNSLDNRKCNLRICTFADNARNARPKHGILNTRGVSMTKSGKYRSRIMVNRKEILLGWFDTIEEAKQARIEAENKYFGEYAPNKRE